jgi:RNA-binding, Nab2-type zinc finger
MVKKRTKYTAVPLSFFDDKKLPSSSPTREERDATLKEPVDSDKKKKNRPCNYGVECKRTNCVFMHPGEKMPPREPRDKVKEERPFRKTRMCKYVKKCGKGKNCPFAHHESEIYIPECRYGYRCKKQRNEVNWTNGGVNRGCEEDEYCKFSHPPPPPRVIIENSSSVLEQPKEEYEFEAENFPIATGCEYIEPTLPSIDFSCLADEDFSQKHEREINLIEQSKGKCTVGGSIDEMMMMVETMDCHDIYQYTFILKN